MNKTSYDFSPPPIIGVLGDVTQDHTLAQLYERALRRRGYDATCLPFRVQPRHLKNLIACMRLMDIAGLVIHPSLQKKVMRWLSSVEPAARDAGFVDVVIRRANRFVGMNAWVRAKEQKPHAAPSTLDRLRRSIALELIYAKG